MKNPSLRRHEGYLMINHRDSPGVPGGVPANTMFEAPTVQCCHCGTIFIVNPDRVRPRHYCANCDQYVCDSAGCNSECYPFAKRLDDIEKKAILEEQAQKATIWLPDLGEF